MSHMINEAHAAGIFGRDADRYGHAGGMSPTGGGGGGASGSKPGDRQWVTNNVGLLEEQVWTGTRWMATGQVRNPIDTGGVGGTGSAGPQWRPGELELEQKALEQRIEELNLQAQHDEAAAEQAHQNALAQLEIELQHASEMQKERIQAEINLENARHENDMAELKERIAAEKKMLIYGEVGAERRTLIEQQGAMERELLQLGPDPSAQAAGLSGQVTRGITPQAMAVGQAKQFINQPLPQVSMDMPLSQLEAALGGLQGIQAPSFGGQGMAGPLGMAKGGIIEMEKGKDGKFGRKQTVLVGEAGPEVLTVDKGKVQVTPLTGTAQFGARIGGIGTANPRPTPSWTPSWPAPLEPNPRPTVPPGWTPEWSGSPTGTPSWLQPYTGGPYPDPLVQSLLQGLQPLYGGSAFGQVPTAEGYGRIMGPEGPMDPSRIYVRADAPGSPGQPITFNPSGGMSTLDMASQLGIAPQLVRTESGHTYFIQGGKRHYIFNGSNPETLTRLGLNPAQVVMVSDAGLERYPPGSTFTGEGEQAAGAVTGGGGFGAMGAPLIEPTSGALLPAPHKVAGIWNQLSTAQKIPLISAYKAAGIDPRVLQETIMAATPAGMGTGRRIGGIGAQF